MTPDDFPAGGYFRDYLGFWAVWLVVVGATVAFFRATRGRSGRVRLVVGNLFVFASLFWTALVLAETYLRYVYDATNQWGLTLTNVSWFKRRYACNSKGFRDREFTSRKRPGVVRIGCVGDSFTMGWGIRDPKNAWPQRLGTLLEERTPGLFETLNLGQAGKGTGDEAELLDQVASRGVFERVIIGYCLNDVDDLLPLDRQFHADTLPRPTWIEPTRSFVVDFFWFRLKLRDDPRVADADAREREAYENPDVWDKQRARFAHIAETCRSAGLALDVVVFPFFSDWGEGYRFGACHDRVVQTWNELGVPAIDLRDAYRGIPGSDLVVNRFDGHPNERANDIAARTIADRLFGGH